MEPGTVPGVQRLATTSSGSHRPVTEETGDTLSAGRGRTGTTGRSRGSSPPTASSRTQASTPSSWAGYGSQPARAEPSRASPCQWQTRVPHRTGLSRKGAPR